MDDIHRSGSPMQQAEALLQQGNLADALAQYRKMVSERPELIPPRLKASEILRRLARYEEALAELSPVLRQSPYHYGALVKMCRIQDELNMHAAALDTARLVSQRYPERGEPHLLAARQLKALGELDAAEGEIMLCLDREAGHVAGLLFMGNLAEAKQQGSGIPWFRQAVAQSDTPFHAYLRLAESLVNSGHHDEARNILVAGTLRLPDQPAIAHRLVKLDWQRGLLESAYATITQFIHQFPADLSLRLQQASWATVLGKFNTAADLLNQCHAASEDEQQQILMGRADLAAESFDFAAAKRHLQEAAATGRESIGLHEKLARYHIYALEFREGREQLEKSRVIRVQHAERTHREQSRNGLGIGSTWLNEYRSNPFANERLRHVTALPAVQRPAAIAEIIRDEPGHTPAAIQLMVELRRLGWLEEMAAQCGEKGVWPESIPRKIVKFWDSSEIPQDISALIASWDKAGDRFETIVFDEPRAIEYLRAHHAPVVLKAYRKCKTIPMKADLFRLAYLFREGGVYSDADDYCRHPITALARSRADLMLYQEEQGSTGNNFIAVAPHHPVMGDAFEQATQEIITSNHPNTWFSTGPGQVTRSVTKQLSNWIVDNNAHDGVGFPPWIVMPRHELLSCISQHIRCQYHKTGASWQHAEAAKVNLHRSV